MVRYQCALYLLVLAVAFAVGQPGGGLQDKAAGVGLSVDQAEVARRAAARQQTSPGAAASEPVQPASTQPQPGAEPAAAAAAAPQAQPVAAATPATAPPPGADAATAAAAAQTPPPAAPAPTDAAAAGQVAPGAQPAPGAATAAAASDPAAAAAALGVSPSPGPRRRNGTRRRRRPRVSPSPSPAPLAPSLQPNATNATAPGAPNTTDAANTPGAVLPGAIAPGDNSTAALNGTANSPNATADPALGNISSSPVPAADGESANPTQDEAGAVAEAVNGTGTDGNTTGELPVPVSDQNAASNSTASVAPRKSQNVGAIVGGILGALAALVLLVAIAGLIAWNRRRRLRAARGPYAAKKPPSPHKSHGLPFTLPWKRQQQQQLPRQASYPAAPGPYKPGGPPPNYYNGSQVYNSRPPSGLSGPPPPAGPLDAPQNGFSNRDASYGSRDASFGHRDASYGSRDVPYSSREASYGNGAAFGAGAAGLGAAAGVGALMGSGPARQAMTVGYTGDELQEGLKGLKYILTNKLLPAVDNAALSVDPIAAWIDAGLAEVRPDVSNPAYGVSHTFVEDWRTHRVWDWLSREHWSLIPTDERLLDVQVAPEVPQKEYARQMLREIKRNPRFQPFASAVDDAVEALLEDAVRVAQAMGVMRESALDSSSHRWRDQAPAIPAAAQAAASYYRPVLTQLFEAALRFHLQVQGTSDTGYIFVPGSPPAVNLPVPERGLLRKDRLGGGTVADVQYFCERPGVLSQDPRATSGVEVWVPAYAIRAGLRR